MFGTSIINEVVELHSVDSTNTYALGTGRPGLLVTAREQTAGRGRMGRSWFSPEGLNLYMTITLDSMDPRLTLVAGVAVQEALSGIAGKDNSVEIKWPNDILVCGKKVCGILCESRKITAVGIGINVNQKDWPPELEHRATSLSRVIGAELDKTRVLQQVTASLDAWVARFGEQGFEPVRERFLEHGMLRLHALETEDGHECRIVDLDSDGHLHIEKSGAIEELISGSLVVRKSLCDPKERGIRG